MSEWVGPTVTAVLGLIGGGLTYLKFRLDRSAQLSKERLDAYSGLLAELHVLNNTHLTERGQDEPTPGELEASYAARDEVWRQHSRIKLLAPDVVMAAADALVSEYMTSAWGRSERKAPDRAERKKLREAFILAARKDVPYIRK